MTFPSGGTYLAIRRRSDGQNLIPPFAARGLTQTFGWIDLASQIETTINGKLLDVGGSQFQKFETTISCTDFRPPLLELLTPGLAVEVDCVAELGYPSSGAATRAVVSGSLRTEGSFKFYRPQLRCWVMTPANSREEYTTTNNWSIVLREDGH
jgi:hypothetical protein